MLSTGGHRPDCDMLKGQQEEAHQRQKSWRKCRQEWNRACSRSCHGDPVCPRYIAAERETKCHFGVEQPCRGNVEGSKILDGKLSLESINDPTEQLVRGGSEYYVIYV